MARPNTQQAVHITVRVEESAGQGLQAFLVSGAVHERHHSIKPGRGGCGGSWLLLPELLVPLNVGVRVLNIFFSSFPSLVCSPPLYLLNIEDLCQAGRRLKGTISQCISTFHKGSVIWEVLAGPVITTGNNRPHKGNGVWTIIHIC